MAIRPLIPCLALMACAAHAPLAHAADSFALTPFKEAAAEPPPPWHFVGLPGQTKPKTRFSVVEHDGKTRARILVDGAPASQWWQDRIASDEREMSWFFEPEPEPH